MLRRGKGLVGGQVEEQHRSQVAPKHGVSGKEFRRKFFLGLPHALHIADIWPEESVGLDRRTTLRISMEHYNASSAAARESI